MKHLGFITFVALLFVLSGRPGWEPSTVTAKVGPTGPPASADPTQTIVPFLRALKRGDLHRMQTHMTPALYEQYRTLFEQNRRYPAFLRKFYRGAKLSVGSMTVGHDEAKAEIPIARSGRRTTSAHVTLTRDADGHWKVNRLFD